MSSFDSNLWNDNQRRAAKRGGSAWAVSAAADAILKRQLQQDAPSLQYN